MKLIILFLFTILTIPMTGQVNNPSLMYQNHKQYRHVTDKMDIIPGLWRPMFGSEQVAWISPSWESEEYVWLDFPEAIWVENKMIYLGHIDKRFPTLFPAIKSAIWHKTSKGINYEQLLPNGISFGGEISKIEPNIASLKIWIHNGSNKELKEVKLLTCTYLNAIKEFDEETDANKFIHTPDKGWIPYLDTVNLKIVNEGCRVGWLDGKQVSDLPVIVVKSKIEGHLLGVTWYNNTFSFIGNPAHPCVHADPSFSNIKPDNRQEIEGEIIFFEGSFEAFEKMFRLRQIEKEKLSKD